MSKGVYGIYFGDELVYIGSTFVSFEERFKQHKESVMGKRKASKIHYAIKDAKQKGVNVKFQILIDVDQLDYNGVLMDGRDVESMEFALIRIFMPRYNIQGVSKPFNYCRSYDMKRLKEDGFDF